MSSIRTRGIAMAVLCLPALGLAACGSGPPVPTEKYVYTSANDCVEAKRLKPEQCAKGVEQALSDHDTKAPKFPTMSDCEAKRGIDRCERFTERHYRARLLGYLFVVNKTMVASPLYADPKKASVLVDISGAAFDWQRTEGVKFSEAAATRARNLQAPKKPRRT